MRRSALRRPGGLGLLAACAVAPALPAGAAAQQAVADSLWRQGDRSAAVEEYRRILADDPLAVQANFRVGEELAASNVDSAIAYVRNARVRVPDDPDLLFTEAKYLSWAARFDEAIARYDTLISAHPELDYARNARARVYSWSGRLEAAARGYGDVLERNGADADARREAEFGLAQVAAWQGKLADAGARYERLLADDPTEVRSLIGLAAVRNWQGRPYAAGALLDRALAREPANPDALSLVKTVALARAPTLSVTATWSHDSDGNDNAWQSGTQSWTVRDGTRVAVTVGNQSADDPARRTSRMLGEVEGSLSRRKVRIGAAVGARKLGVQVAPNSPGDRSELTWRGSLGVDALPTLQLGLGVSRVPFDEVAALLVRDVNLTNFEGSASWRGPLEVTVDASGGVLHLSDGNRRTGGSLRVARRVAPGVTVGALGRTFSFAREGVGYFTPSRFLLGEVQATWDVAVARWSVGVSAGGGAQRLGPDRPVQGQWHGDARVSAPVASRLTLDAFFGVSNSAAASAVGAFRYRAGGLSARLSF